MSESSTVTKKPRADDAVVALLLRLGAGFAIFLFGLDKFLGPGGVRGAIEGLEGMFKGSYLPAVLVAIYAHIIPPVEVVLGSMVVVGLFTRTVLVLAAFYMVGLIVGVTILGKPNITAHNLIYVLILSLAYWFASRDNRYSLDHLFHIRRGA